MTWNNERVIQIAVSQSDTVGGGVDSTVLALTNHGRIAYGTWGGGKFAWVHWLPDPVEKLEEK